VTRMAAQISHMLAGEEALRKALDGAPLGEALCAFRFGCQGPDIFYHNQRTKPSGLHYGALAHRRRSGTLVAGAASALPEAERNPDSPRGAYVLGLSTHAALDRATHPFIICFSGWMDPSDPSTRRRRGCHPFLERLLDARLIERRMGIAPAEFGISARMGTGAPFSAELDSSLIAPWAAGIRAAFPRATAADALLEARIANALADARGFYAITDPASPRASRDVRISELEADEARYIISVIYPLRVPEGMDPMNEAKAEWPHPAGDGRVSRASYPELVDSGTEEAARAIGLVLGFWRGELSAASLAQGLGEGSLALCDAEGAAAAPRICRPLALPEAMDAEYASRVADARGARSDAPSKRAR
jgi:hypothetical protein